MFGLLLFGLKSNYCSLLITHYSLLITHYSLLITYAIADETQNRYYYPPTFPRPLTVI
ncbi:MAG: hypothetical protein F6K47_11940 [Symploca sp. SIO2E6]|nr:hypothetical protein [Symploca sp. SIO2E6]